MSTIGSLTAMYSIIDDIGAAVPHKRSHVGLDEVTSVVASAMTAGCYCTLDLFVDRMR